MSFEHNLDKEPRSTINPYQMGLTPLFMDFKKKNKGLER